MFTYSPIHYYIHRVKLDELSEYAITVVKPLLSEKRLKDFRILVTGVQHSMS